LGITVNIAAMTGAASACLRCSGQALVHLPSQGNEIEFFECPACLRQYARQLGGSLTYRWLHPISLVLYGFSSRSKPSKSFASRATLSVQKGRTSAEIAAFVQEVEIELQEPTQQVRDILNTEASEAECRAFLASVVSLIRRSAQP
jgi:hypothetical protein